MKWLSLIALVFVSSAFAAKKAPAAAAPAAEEKAGASTAAEPDFDSLGGNRMLLERAKLMNPDQTVSVVQNRAVNRRMRVELAPEVSGVMGGDTYTRARSIGLNAYWHITPRWALGAKYNYSFNTLTPEGQALLDQANEDFKKDPETPTVGFPEPDYQKHEWIALVNWFPLYGKFSVLDSSVIHFDFYLLAGGGQTTLSSGVASSYTGGAGLGLWLTQHFTTRMEMRYQNYEAKYKTGPRKLDLTVASVQMGWLL